MGLEELEAMKSVIASIKDLRAVIESDLQVVIDSDRELKSAIKSRTIDCRHSSYRVDPHTDMDDPVELPRTGGTGLVKVLLLRNYAAH